MGQFRRFTAAACAGLLLCVGLLLVAAMGPARAQGAADGDPASFVAEVGQQVIAVLDTPDATEDQRDLAFRKVFDRSMDTDVMARRALGHHWRRASQSQRETYLRLFRDHVIRIYAAQLSSYAGENFSVLRKQAAQGSESVVLARITGKHGTPLDLSFRVRNTDGSFHIVDMNLSGVSLIVTKRSEFNAIVRREGMPGLLRRLEETNRGVQQENGIFSTLVAKTVGKPVQILIGGAVAVMNGAKRLIIQ